ncbi:Uncharacterised protein [Bordetella pertussis]|nr:Uncharacterised protein [Bordetella pertussis]
MRDQRFSAGARAIGQRDADRRQRRISWQMLHGQGVVVVILDCIGRQGGEHGPILYAQAAARDVRLAIEPQRNGGDLSVDVGVAQAGSRAGVLVAQQPQAGGPQASCTDLGALQVDLTVLCHDHAAIGTIGVTLASQDIGVVRQNAPAFHIDLRAERGVHAAGSEQFRILDRDLSRPCCHHSDVICTHAALNNPALDANRRRGAIIISAGVAHFGVQPEGRTTQDRIGKCRFAPPPNR